MAEPIDQRQSARLSRTSAASLLAGMTPRDTALFRAWLGKAGWVHQSEGGLGELLRYGGATVALPRDLWRDPLVAVGVAERVAAAMSSDVREVVRRLVAPLTDRIELRLIGQALDTGRVPLGAATEALKNGRRLLSASGTSAISPSWSVAKRYRPEAQQLARDAELAHTEDGSFIFPLFIALDRTREATLPYDDDSVIPEPYERRVTRTLATAVTSAVNLTNRSIEGLADDDLDKAASVGVSRELCISLDELMKNSSVEQVAIRFDWSRAFGPIEKLPTAIEIPREVRPQFRRLAERLSRPEPIVSETYSGPILEIGHSSGDDGPEGFFFVLDTYFRERKSKLRVMLNEIDHERSISWYRDRSTVIIRGRAQQLQSGLLMSDPERIEAWTSSTLSS